MSERIDITATINLLLKANNILILCHKNPDGDTLGSAGALYWALHALGKTAAIFCADAVPSRYDYMKLELFRGQFVPGYIVAVDIAGQQLFGEAAAEYTEKVDLCIDHHTSNSGYATAMLLDDTAAATGEVIYEMIVAMGVAITPQIANCLYTGISTDTGCYQYANT
ncbi:DHH family phosphoesterase, partial [Ruminococcaceae bacterium OttesenSCG-928-A16]|nr:DHH family phosphoesterase [Ruminococcaceae bacterium OttesenSCG-928-A16]